MSTQAHTQLAIGAATDEPTTCGSARHPTVCIAYADATLLPHSGVPAYHSGRAAVTTRTYNAECKALPGFAGRQRLRTAPCA